MSPSTTWRKGILTAEATEATEAAIAAGETGVRRTIELLTEELRTLMILAGIPGIASIPPGTVTRRPA
jgi:isopentenyl diphosphate isomerase/L-lactate dehydrogenase-like FMN-dependent dehydrogenase